MVKKVKCTPGWKALSYRKWRQEILRLNAQEWFDKIFVKKGDFKKPNTVIDSKCPPPQKKTTVSQSFLTKEIWGGHT